MTQYIDKSSVVAEIKKLKGKVNDSSSYCNGWQQALCMLEIELNTLEVKDVDLEMEKIKNIEKQCPFRKIICEKYENHPLKCSGACAFVCDRITLEKKHQHDIKNVPVDEEKLRNDRRNTI